MHIKIKFCPYTGEAPLIFVRGDGAVFRLWCIARGGAYPGTYTITQYAPKPKNGALPVKEWERLCHSDALALLHTLLYKVAPVSAPTFSKNGPNAKSTATP